MRCRGGGRVDSKTVVNESSTPGRQSVPDAPDWLCAEFASRGKTAPVFVRSGSAVVWRDTQRTVVAKTYPIDDESRCRAEQAIAMAALDAGVHTARPLGVSSHSDAAVGWFEHLDILAQETSPLLVARLLRNLHDGAKGNGGIPPMPSLSAVGAADSKLSELVAPLARQAQASLTGLQSDLPDVVVHGDANPTNVIVTPQGTALIDWGRGGAGPRVWDVAVVAQLAVECGNDPLDAERVTRKITEAYGEHPDVSYGTVEFARGIVAVERLVACTRQAEWRDEGWARLDRISRGTEYVFGDTEGPK